MPYREPRKILFGFYKFHRDGDRISHQDLPSEYAFLPEYYRPDPQFLHPFQGQPRLGQEFDPAQCSPVIVNRVTKVKIRVKVRPAYLYREDKILHILLILRDKIK